MNTAQVAKGTNSRSRSPRRQNQTGMVRCEGSQSIKKLIYFKCNEVGHVARYCPKSGNGTGQT